MACNLYNVVGDALTSDVYRVNRTAESSPLWCSGAADCSENWLSDGETTVRQARQSFSLQRPSDELWSDSPFFSGYQVGVDPHLHKLVTQSDGLDCVKGTGEIKEHDSHITIALEDESVSCVVGRWWRPPHPPSGMQTVAVLSLMWGESITLFGFTFLKYLAYNI